MEPAVGEAASIATALTSVMSLVCSVGLMGSAAILMALEIHLPTHGILGLGGVAAFLLGGFLLFAPPETAAPVLAIIQANVVLLGMMAGLFGVIGVVAARASLRVRRMPVLDPLGRLAGARGVAASPLAPSGIVLVLRERWSAVTEGAAIEPGEPVEVVEREGLTLRVRRLKTGGAGVLSAQGQVRPGVRVERSS
jgi:membrane-bound serine protease (ClpP class)